MRCEDASGFIWLKMFSSGVGFSKTEITLGFNKIRVISWQDQTLSVSHDGPYFMELVKTQRKRTSSLQILLTPRTGFYSMSASSNGTGERVLAFKWKYLGYTGLEDKWKNLNCIWRTERFAAYGSN
jgi:hypothetical protein